MPEQVGFCLKYQPVLKKYSYLLNYSLWTNYLPHFPLSLETVACVSLCNQYVNRFPYLLQDQAYKIKLRRPLC